MRLCLIVTAWIVILLTGAPAVTVAYDRLQADMALCTRGNVGTQAKAMVDACSRLISNAKAENETVGTFYVMRAIANTDKQQNCQDARKGVALIKTPSLRATAKEIETSSCAASQQAAATAPAAAPYDGLAKDFATCLNGNVNTQAKDMVDACTRLINNAKAENETVGMFYVMRAVVNTDKPQNCRDVRKALTLVKAPQVRTNVQDLEKHHCVEPAPRSESDRTANAGTADLDGCIKGSGKAQVDACSRIIASAKVEDESVGVIYAVRAAVSTDKTQNCLDARKALTLLKSTHRHYAGAQTLERNNCSVPRADATESNRENKPQGVDYYSTLSCDELWSERNAILARNGHCFQSPREIAAFGKGCTPPYGKLPDNLTRVVNDIKGWEARRRCN